MSQITVEGLGKEEEAYLRELTDEYGSVDFLDFQDIAAVQAMAKGLRRLLDRLTVKPDAPKPGKKVPFIS